MDKHQMFEEFLASRDTFRVYDRDRLVFASRKEQLQPIFDYLDRVTPQPPGAMMFDRIVGNAAALLLKKAYCGEVHAPLGSELAASTLKQHGISFNFTATVPHIVDKSGADMCPTEKLSMGKSPDEFCVVMRHMMHVTRPARSKN